ncbi:hypothetical protein SCMU_11120 [Sinomonas cyclohexanicum]|uniref:Uncharacterized protein n=1 Tax=Sinomonas cyclohexanicum TaxID=322009 RepID=A0ABN6FEH4_SINCY|nr:hypothetical protein [Corynebacterium cyclohexanicum]BCT75270.1 hypothetical protein SCMU_11120 [Corynebacterium cyclohexanicum]
MALGYASAWPSSRTASYLLVWFQSLHADWIFPTYVAVLSALSVLFYVLARRSSGLYVGK